MWIIAPSHDAVCAFRDTNRCTDQSSNAIRRRNATFSFHRRIFYRCIRRSSSPCIEDAGILTGYKDDGIDPDRSERICLLIFCLAWALTSTEFFHFVVQSFKRSLNFDISKASSLNISIGDLLVSASPHEHKPPSEPVSGDAPPVLVW